MPFLQITTSVDTDSKALAKEASAFAAGMLGKPEAYVMVLVRSNADLAFAGSDAPCAHVKLKSLGLPESRTAEFSQRICAFLHERLDIAPARVYIEFTAPARHLWGWDSGTF